MVTPLSAQRAVSPVMHSGCNLAAAAIALTRRYGANAKHIPDARAAMCKFSGVGAGASELTGKVRQAQRIALEPELRWRQKV